MTNTIIFSKSNQPVYVSFAYYSSPEQKENKKQDISSILEP